MAPLWAVDVFEKRLASGAHLVAEVQDVIAPVSEALGGRAGFIATTGVAHMGGIGVKSPPAGSPKTEDNLLRLRI